SRVRRLIHIRRVRVEQVEDVECDQRLRVTVSQILAKTQIRLAQTLVVQLTWFDDVQELDRQSAGERPSQVQIEAADREALAAEALAGDAREVVSRVRNAMPGSAEQHVDLGDVVRRQPLVVGQPSRLAMAERERPLANRRVELLEEVE